MKDDVPTGTILINKNGEFLDKVTPLDSVGGWISHLFQYVTGNLKDVTFEVYALEDVKAADGESEDYYKKDELVATIMTDDTGVAKVSGLPLGKYYVKEKATVDGFVLDDKAREIDLTYRDQDTAEVTYSADWQNNRQKAEVEVVKKEKDSDRVLEGAVFALCAKNDITGADGKVILKADSVIEELATDKEGKLTFTADMPIGFEYYIKETTPAPGFATTDEVQEFKFEYEGADKEKVTYSFTFEDEPTVIEVTKTSLTDALQQVLYVLDMIREDIEEKANALDGVRKKRLKQLELENDKLKSERMRQYEAYAEGIITKDKYLLMKQQLTDKVNRNETDMERLAQLSVEESAYENKVASAIELLDGEMQHEKITQELVDATIDTVYVYDKKRIEVVFKFDDILMRAIEKYQKGEKEA